MSTPLEHDYIGLSSEVEKEKITASSSSSSTLTSTEEQKNDKNNNNNNALNLKETELRLGLPGSESPERKGVVGTTASLGLTLLKTTTFVPGAKRGFSDAIDGNKWGVFSAGGNGGGTTAGSEVDLGKGAGGANNLFSPRSGGTGGKPLGGGLENTTTTAHQQQSAGCSGAATTVKDGINPLSPKGLQEKKPQISAAANDQAPPAKAQVVGWPPIRSFRKNTMATNTTKNSDDAKGKSGSGCLYVKVSMDGAPYLRKVDLKIYSNYMELSSALEKMFTCFTIGQCSSHGATGRDGLSESRLMDLLHGSEYVLTYEDKDNDWMLVGDVPWEMFTDSCKRLRIMKGSEAIGLAPRAMEKCKNRN